MTVPAELVIEVTADDIASGAPSEAFDCPIALAVMRLYGAKRCCTGTRLSSTLWVTWDDESAHYLMPDDALTFVDRFDGIADGDPEPFTFTARLESAP